MPKSEDDSSDISPEVKHCNRQYGHESKAVLANGYQRREVNKLGAPNRKPEKREAPITLLEYQKHESPTTPFESKRFADDIDEAIREYAEKHKAKSSQKYEDSVNAKSKKHKQAFSIRVSIKAIAK